MLTPQQLLVASIVGSSIGDLDFALAGGAALIAKSIVNRGTEDLDFFGPSPAALEELFPVVIENLAAEGFGIMIRQPAPTFVRFTVQGAEGDTEVDLAVDARLVPSEPGELSRVPCALQSRTMDRGR